MGWSVQRRGELTSLSGPRYGHRSPPGFSKSSSHKVVKLTEFRQLDARTWRSNIDDVQDRPPVEKQINQIRVPKHGQTKSIKYNLSRCYTAGEICGTTENSVSVAAMSAKNSQKFNMTWCREKGDRTLTGPPWRGAEGWATEHLLGPPWRGAAGWAEWIGADLA